MTLLRLGASARGALMAALLARFLAVYGCQTVLLLLLAHDQQGTCQDHRERRHCNVDKDK
jgi:hypothetical protein